MSKYGWFSMKQAQLFLEVSQNNKKNNYGLPMYKHKNGNNVVCTMVTDDMNHSTRFTDIICLGEVNKFIEIYKGDIHMAMEINSQSLTM